MKFSVFSITDDMAEELTHSARFGRPVQCPHCAHKKLYSIRDRGQVQCAKCGTRSGLTNGSWLSASKITPRQIVMAATLFCNAKKGISSLEMSRHLGMQQSSVYKLLMKFRNAIYSESLTIRLRGVVEVDGAFFGGHVKHQNMVLPGRKVRYSRRHGQNRRVVVVLKQRLGRTLTFVGARESDAINFITTVIEPDAVIQSDQSHAWDCLQKLYDTMRINHKFAFSSNNACTNNAEAYFSSLRRMATGTHHRISGRYLHLYAAEMAWKNDFAKEPELDRVVRLLGLALSPAPYRDTGPYWSWRQERKARSTPVLPDDDELPDPDEFDADLAPAAADLRPTGHLTDAQRRAEAHLNALAKALVAA